MSSIQRLTDLVSSFTDLLAAAAITEGAGRADAQAEAQACLARHAFEEPGIDSAVRMVTEMKQWAEGR